MAAAGNPNSPTGLREGGFILQHGTHSDKTRDFGGVGAAGRECGVSGRWNVGKTKHFPSVHAATPTAERGGSSELLSPRLQRSARHCQVRLPNPSTGEKRLKKKKKTHTPLYYCGFSIKAHQGAAGGKGKPRDAEKKRNKQTAVREAEKPGEGKPRSAPTGSAPAWPGKPGIGTGAGGLSLSLQARAGVGLHCRDPWPLRGGTRHRAQDSKHMKGTACGRWGGGARRSKEEGLWGLLRHSAGFLIQHSLEGFPHPPRWSLGPLRTQKTLSSDRLFLSHQSQILSRPLPRSAVL